jgi:hypothetical protein
MYKLKKKDWRHSWLPQPAAAPRLDVAGLNPRARDKFFSSP